MFCRKCGNEIPDDSIFCLKCGAKIEVVEDIVREEVIEEEIENFEKQDILIDDISKENSDKTVSTSRKKIAGVTFGGLVLLLLVIISVVGVSESAKLCGCGEYKIDGSDYCKVHTCEKDGCYSFKYKNDTYCNMHKKNDNYFAKDKSFSYELNSTDDLKNSIPQKKDIHFCEVENCNREGTKKIIGFSGEMEYYCSSHYNKMEEIIGSMEQAVGASSSSKHRCIVEGCGREGTNAVEGFGGTEYYCSKHYKELIELLAELLEN